jgi:hypothetical protein
MQRPREAGYEPLLRELTRAHAVFGCEFLPKVDVWRMILVAAFSFDFSNINYCRAKGLQRYLSIEWRPLRRVALTCILRGCCQCS